MSGFIQPQWSGFSGPDPVTADKADIAQHKVEREQLALKRDGDPSPGTPEPELPAQGTEPAPVTSPSPRRHKALTP